MNTRKANKMIRQSIWILLLPATIFFGIAHFAVVAVIDLILMAISFMANDYIGSFPICKEIWNEMLEDDTGQFCGIIEFVSHRGNTP